MTITATPVIGSGVVNEQEIVIDEEQDTDNPFEKRFKMKCHESSEKWEKKWIE
jgi:hypothetical protein